MNSTDSALRQRMFIISFGDSRKYKLITDSYDRHTALEPVDVAEADLTGYLKRLFPADTFAYFTTPRITEVDIQHADRYADYPDFNEQAVREIKEELKHEVEVMEANREHNSNDPWGTGATGITFPASPDN